MRATHIALKYRELHLELERCSNGVSMVVFALFLFKNLVPIFWVIYMAKISKDNFVYMPLQLSIQDVARVYHQCVIEMALFNPTTKAEMMSLNLYIEYKP